MQDAENIRILCIDRMKTMGFKEISEKLHITPRAAMTLFQRREWKLEKALEIARKLGVIVVTAQQNPRATLPYGGQNEF